MARHSSANSQSPLSHRPLTRRTSTRTKLLASVVAVGAAASVAGLGTFGTFTSTTSIASPSYTSGTVTLAFDNTLTTNVLSTGVSAMAAGDTAERGFALINSGSLHLADVALTIGATGGTNTGLYTDATNGLQVQIQECPAAWTAAGGTGGTPYTYSCSGTPTTPLPLTPLATLVSGGTPTALGGSLASLTPGGSDSLMMTISLPSGASNAVQGATANLSISFTATQRAGTAV